MGPGRLSGRLGWLIFSSSFVVTIKRISEISSFADPMRRRANRRAGGRRDCFARDPSRDRMRTGRVSGA
jgi:hypothetical protein